MDFVKYLTVSIIRFLLGTWEMFLNRKNTLWMMFAAVSKPTNIPCLRRYRLTGYECFVWECRLLHPAGQEGVARLPGPAGEEGVAGAGEEEAKGESHQPMTSPRANQQRREVIRAKGLQKQIRAKARLRYVPISVGDLDQESWLILIVRTMVATVGIARTLKTKLRDVLKPDRAFAQSQRRLLSVHP
jgi:hypothetical protein